MVVLLVAGHETTVSLIGSGTLALLEHPDQLDKLRRGGLVPAVIASANRDRQVFADPDRPDITRIPNKHLSFGLGAHYCLGAALARMEGQIALSTLLRQASGLRLAVGPQEVRWRPGLVLRGLEGLPVAVEWTRAATSLTQ
jgi:cytochrome P450 PksS